MATALVTGATAGIGNAYAQLLAKEGFDLILVARNLPRLKKVAAQLSKDYGVKATCLKADLSESAQLLKVEKVLASTSRPVEVLINNAGFGIKESFTDSNIKAEQELLDVLVTAPMRPSVRPQSGGRSGLCLRQTPAARPRPQPPERRQRRAARCLGPC